MVWEEGGGGEKGREGTYQDDVEDSSIDVNKHIGAQKGTQGKGEGRSGKKAVGGVRPVEVHEWPDTFFEDLKEKEVGGRVGWVVGWAWGWVGWVGGWVGGWLTYRGSLLDHLQAGKVVVARLAFALGGQALCVSVDV